jgi:uroporphyrinogen III methyltransferase/synthase
METVVLTASAGAFSGLAEALRDVPVVVEERPLVSFTPPLDWAQLDTALADITRYPALAFTSPRSAEAVVERIRRCGIVWHEGIRPAVWAVGAGTTAALQSTLGTVRQPARQTADESGAAAALARAMLEARLAGPVLFPCGEKHRTELPAMLRAHGVEVDEVVCYRAVLANPSQARAAVAGSSVLVVASPSVVELLADVCPPAARPQLVAIGPTTAASARAVGWPPAAVTSEPSTRALASAITGLLAAR